MFLETLPCADSDMLSSQLPKILGILSPRGLHMWYSFPPEHFPPHFTWQTSHFPSSSSVSSSPSPSRKGNKSTLGVSTLGVCQQTQHHHGLWPHSDYLGASEISSSSYNPPSYAQLPSSLPLSPCPHPLLDKNATHPIAATLGR